MSMKRAIVSEPYVVARDREWVCVGLGQYKHWYHEWQLPAIAPYYWLRAHNIAMDVRWSFYGTIDTLCDRILLDVVHRH